VRNAGTERGERRRKDETDYHFNGNFDARESSNP
jgi:hypothetical protein